MSDFVLDTLDDDAVWDALVQSSPQGSPFSYAGFLKALGVTARRWHLCDKAGTSLLVWPMLYGDDGTPLPAPFPLTMYHGPILCPGLTDQPAHRRTLMQLDALETVMGLLAARQGRIAACCHPTLDDLRALLWFNYHTPEQGQPTLKLRYTGLLDLDPAEPFETITERFRENRNRDYRKSVKAGLVLSESRDIDLLDDLHVATFARQGLERDAVTAAILKSIALAVLNGGFGELLLASLPDGTPIAATLFLHDATCAYYLIGANHPDYRQLGAGTWLMIENIRRAHAAGRRTVDFVGINSPNRGDFKTSFNARPAAYFDVDWRRPALVAPELAAPELAD